MKRLLLLGLIGIIGINTIAQGLVWAKSMASLPTNSGNGSAGTSVVVDAYGSVYTTGVFSGKVDFNPGTDTFYLTCGSNNYPDIFISKLDSSGNFIWAKSIGEAGWDDIATGIAIDDSANIILTGHFRGTVDFDPGPGVNYISSGNPINTIDAFILKLDSAGNFVWVKNLESSSWSEGYSIILDKQGYIYTTGSFVGTTDFDPGTGTYPISSISYINGQSGDIFILKLDPSGNFVWAKSMGGNLEVFSYSIALDASGNVYTTGAFRGTVDFDPGSGTYNLSYSTGGPGISGYDVFILKLDSSGNFVWAKRFAGTSGGGDLGRSLAVDASGNVYTTGGFTNTLDFDPNSGVSNFTSAGNLDIFISKLDASGTMVWTKTIGGTGSDFGLGITLDTLGNIYTTGTFTGTVDFDPGSNQYNIATGSRFILKLDPSGNFVWARGIGGTYYYRGNFIKVDKSMNIYTTGGFSQTQDFDPGTGTFNMTAQSNEDIFVQKLGVCFQPSLVTINGPNAVCALSTVTYTVNQVTGATGYSWTVPQGSILVSGQNTATITIAMGSTSGNLSVTPFNTCGTGTTKTIPITINSLPKAKCFANNASKTFPVSGCSPLMVNLSDSSLLADSVWYNVKNNTGYQALFTTNNFQINDTGWFDMVQHVRSNAGCLDSFTVKNAIYVSPANTVQVFIDSTYDRCIQNKLRLKIISSFGTGVTVNWGDGSSSALSGIANGSKTDTISHYYTSTGNFDIQVVSSNAYCVSLNPLNHLVHAPIQLQTSNDTTVCSGAFANLRIKATGADSNFTYLLQTPSSVLYSSNGVFFLVPDSTTTFRMGAVNACAQDTIWKSVTVTVHAPLVLHLNFIDTIVCKGSPVLILATASGGNGVYEYRLMKNRLLQQSNTTGNFSITATANEIYTVVLTDHCTVLNDSLAFTIKIFTPLQFTRSYPDLYLCNGETTVLQAQTNSGSGMVKYAFIDASTSAILSNTDTLLLSPTTTQQILLRATDACSSIYDTIQLYVFASANSMQLHNDVASGCVPLSVNFETPTLTYSNSQPCEVTWDFGDGAFLTQHFDPTSATLKASHGYPYAGVYPVVAAVKFKSNTKICYSFTTTVEALLLPQVKLAIEPKKITLPKTECSATITTFNADSLVLDWGDGFSDNFNLTQSPTIRTHNYADTGHFVAKATAFHKNTCYTETSATVYHADTFSCFIPDAFTPNKDNINETFKPILTFCKSYDLTIFNRWGEIVYQDSYSVNKNNIPAWNGEGADPGSYIYILNATDYDHINHSYKGKFMLLK